MKKSLFFQIIASTLIICSALFARHIAEEKKEETAPVMAQTGKGEHEQKSITFSDLAEDMAVFAGVDN